MEHMCVCYEEESKTADLTHWPTNGHCCDARGQGGGGDGASEVWDPEEGKDGSCKQDSCVGRLNERFGALYNGEFALIVGECQCKLNNEVPVLKTEG